MTLLERALCRLFKFTDIQHEGSLYMRRFFLTPPARGGGWELVLHKICRPDADQAAHDHPGDFATLCLRGGYLETVLLPDGQMREAVTAGQVRFRSAEHTHRIDRIFGGAAWTLCLRRRMTNQWGFWRTDRERPEFVLAEEYFRPGYDRAAAPARRAQ